MGKSDLFTKVLSIVIEETGFSQTILFGKQRTVGFVDARSVLVYILYFDIGFNMVEIASFANLSASGVFYLLNRVDDRKKQNLHFKILYNKVKNRVSNEIISNA